jgi:alpha-tubulin suppressor-like RCC1 family protein
MLLICALAAGGADPSFADSSTPRLASYYDRHLAICGGDALEWRGDARPAVVMRDVVQVGVGKSAGYALAKDGRLHTWRDGSRKVETILEGVRYFAAGESGVLAIKLDGSLWSAPGSGGGPLAFTRIAANAEAASVGDGTNYFVTAQGDLFAQGNAHRGQYGDGRLEGTDGPVRVAVHVRDIKSHTGHALLLGDQGEVRGTGGNIYGPLGRHGLGDRALHWKTLFEGATGIATGASHSLAIRADKSLWIWGRNESPDARKVLDDVVGAAAGTDSSIALTGDGSFWQWRTGTSPAKIFECAR